MNRRFFLICASVLPAIGSISAAYAQTKQAPVLIGWLSSGSRKTSAHYVAAFKEGFAALGWKEHRDYVIEERWANARADQLPVLAEQLSAKKPALIVASPMISVIAAAKAAPKTAIVIGNGGDPVAAGVATNLARPGGTITGVTNVSIELHEKNLELLLAAVPKLRRVGFVADPRIPSYALAIQAVRRSIARYPIEARFAEVGQPQDIESAIALLAREGVQALVIMPSASSLEQQRILKLAGEHRWPVVAGLPELAEAGALLTYGADRSALFRRAAYYVDRILKGTKPGDLPIEQPTKFELIVNLKTAKAIGLTIPKELLLRADKVIE